MKKPKNYITPHGYDKLVSERDHLLKVERPETTKVVAWAASLGDRSENADYQYGKKRLRDIDRRIRFLNTRLDAAEVVDPLKIKSDKVQFGATVTICDEDENTRVFSIVGEDESSPRDGLISWCSPIGSRLLGRAAGDIVSVMAPGGESDMEITKIEYKAIVFPKDDAQ